MGAYGFFAVGEVDPIAVSILGKLRHWYDCSEVDSDDQIKDLHNGAHLDQILSSLSGTQFFPSVVASPNGTGLDFPLVGGTDRNVLFANEDGLGEDLEDGEYSMIAYHRNNGPPNTLVRLLKFGNADSVDVGVISVTVNTTSTGQYTLSAQGAGGLSGSGTNIASGNNDWRMTYAWRRSSGSVTRGMEHNNNPSASSSAASDPGIPAGTKTSGRGVVIYGQRYQATEGSRGTAAIAGAAIFNAFLTTEEKEWLYNGGSFRKYNDIRKAAGLSQV